MRKKITSSLLSVCFCMLFFALALSIAQIKAAAAAAPYLGADAATYSMTVKDGLVTVQSKADATLKASFRLGKNNYVNYTPYDDKELSVTEKNGRLMLALPKIAEEATDYYIEVAGLSDYTALRLENLDKEEGTGFTFTVADDTLKNYTKESSEPLRGDLYKGNIPANNPEFTVELIDTGDPADYSCILDFAENYSSAYDGEKYTFGWSLYGEERSLEVVSAKENVKDTVSRDEKEVHSAWLYVKAKDISTYSLKVAEAVDPKEYRLEVDGTLYELDANGMFSIKDLGDHKFHKVALRAALPDLSACDVAFADAYYAGKALSPAETVKNVDGKVLKKGKDYKISYKDNNKIGWGQATLTGIGEYKGSCIRGFEIRMPKKGRSFTVSGLRYTVTDPEQALVTASGAAKKTASSVVVPASVKIGGVAFGVEGISDGAFSGMKKLKTVIIGANVSVIGTKAFYGDKAVKKLTVKSKNIYAAGARVFSGISANAKVTVPSAKKKAYRSIFRKAGLDKKISLG